MESGSMVVSFFADPHADPRPVRVLVVEDDRPTRTAMTYLLRDRGFEVRATADLAGGMAALAWRPHCVVLDLMLPDGSGASLLAHVRRLGLPVRVAVVTATSDPALLDSVAEWRPDLLLRKPTNVDALADFLAGLQ
jgi:DNA-binding response OmpR family regulator